jgi:DNA-binding SARP family transcriptional activator/tetratricopeptide (TPR) repeat protein
MLEVQLLGHLALADSGHRVEVRNPRLLVYLLLNRDRPLERTEVAFTLWPDSSDAQALTNLRRELHALRRTLPDADGLLAVERRTIRWRPDGPFHLDVAAFEDAVARAAEGGVDALRTAVAMYRGDLLPGVYDDWMAPHRDHLRTMMLRTLEALASSLEDRREYRAAMQELSRLVAIDPLAESRYQALMRVAALVGDRTAGLRAYHACVSALRDELGVAPSRETVAAYQRLVRLDVSEVPSRSGSAVLTQPDLVGRVSEWKALVEGWNRTADGALTLALIQGDAGIGKSRLIEELSRWASARGAAVLTARSWAVEGSLAYAPVTAWLRSAPLRPLLDSLEDVWISEISRLVPELLADHPGLAAPAPMLESWQRQRLFEALARALGSARDQLLLVLDDANWADADTLEWLHYLLRTEAVNGYVILGARSGEVESNRALASLVSDARDRAKLLDFELGPLSEADTATLATATADRFLDAAAHARLYRETEGHPLFVVELARAELAGTADPEPVGAAGGGALPARARMTARMRTVIAGRLRQLTPTAQRVVELAAAIGRDFDVDVLAASADLDEAELVDGLDELWGRRIIRQQGFNRYDFSHDRIREVAYEQIAPAARRVLHRRVAQALELRHLEDIDPIAAQLAAQLESAGLAVRAREMYERAAAVAARVSASAEATRHLSRALAILAESPASRERDVLELRLLQLLSPSLVAIEGYASPRQEATVERARALATDLGEELDELFALNGLWAVHVVGGKVDRARDVAEAALRRSARHPDFASASHLAMGGSLTFLGDHEKAVTEFELAITTYMPGASRPLTSGTDSGAFALSWGAHALWLEGRTATAAEWSSRAITLADSLGGPYMRMIAQSYAAILGQIHGDVEAMLEHAAVAAELCSRYGFAYYREWPVILAAWATRGVGSDSPTRIVRALDGLRSIRGLARRPYYLSLLADAHQAAGHFHHARAALDRALADAATSGEQWWVPELHRRLGTLNDGPGGDAAVRRAVDLAMAQGAWSLALRAAIGLAHRAPAEQATLRGVLDAVPEPARQDRLEAEAVLAGTVDSASTNTGANDSRTIDMPASPPTSG